MASISSRPRPFLRLRGKSFMSVVLTPEPPLEGWIAQLDEQIGRSPRVFEGRPVLLDVSMLNGSATDIPGLVDGLAERGIRVIGIDGSVPHDVGSMAPGTLPPIMAGGRNAALLGENEPGYTPPTPQNAAAQAATSLPGTAAPDAVALVLDHPVRSGQSVTHLGGDVTVIGSVASGSEVMAGGSIHVYGTLRGRAIAGLASGGGARPRIFCRKLDAELLAIDGVYKTADEIDPALAGRAVQAWLDGDELRVAALD